MATRGRDNVAPGEVVASDWGNAVWDQSVQCFESVADRNAQFPAPQPGAVCYLADVQQHYLYRPGGWSLLGVVTGVVNLTTAAAAPGVTGVVTFPVGVFGGAVVPRVQVTRAGAGTAKAIPYMVSATASGFTIGIYTGDGTNLPAAVVVPLNWSASA